jgi:predicted PurR-regulated permease PerM
MSKPWSRELRYLILILGLVLLWFLFAYIQPFMGPLVIGALFAYLLNPAVWLLESRTPIGRTAAVVMVFLTGLIIVFALLPLVASPFLVRQVQVLSGELDLIEQQMRIGLSELEALNLPIPIDSIEQSITAIFQAEVQPSQFFRLLGQATTNIGFLLVILVTAFYFLLDWPKLREWLISIFPPQYGGDARHLMDRITDIWSAYLRGQLLLAVLMGIATWIILLIIGLEGAVLLAVLTAALDIIPTLGPAIAMVVTAVVGYFVGSSTLPLTGFWFVVVIVSIFVVIQTLENVVLRPRILGESLRLHPGVVFVAILAALSLSGVVVALIIVPMISSAEVIVRYAWEKLLPQTT